MATKPRVEFYQGANDLWYWRFRAANGRILADSGQGYTERRWARKGWASMRDCIRTGTVEVIRS